MLEVIALTTVKTAHFTLRKLNALASLAVIGALFDVNLDDENWVLEIAFFIQNFSSFINKYFLISF
ncbi:hypothetical protein N483_25705 [Pseudoalteromonas luteoviolacea NCIMB 1944]|nr:hypothetical protein N483_25705 [Pseudoalteromonas luteoviolacea NCIMB 1944]